MISNPFFLLSIVVSSLFAFFTTAFIIEMVVKIFRIRKHRIRSMLRLVPFFSLLLDLVLNQYSIAYWVSPLSCASCIQKLFLELFFPQLKTHLTENHISLVSYLGIGHENAIFSSVYVIFGMLSLFFVLRKLVQTYLLMRSLHAIVKGSDLNKSTVHSKDLQLTLKKNNVNIYFSEKVQVPLTVYPNIIIVPKKMTDTLSPQELDAVIAHEWGHVKYRDPLARLLYHLVAVFFWWVPTHLWIKKLEEEQELACDQSVLKYGINGEAIASALCKVARHVKSHQTVCYFNSRANPALTRIEYILGLREQSQDPVLGLNFLGVVFGAMLLLICVMYL
jgi:beta-lactamase regulating signal transducer with metallopeptidase domain